MLTASFSPQHHYPHYSHSFLIYMTTFLPVYQRAKKTNIMVSKLPSVHCVLGTVYHRNGLIEMTKANNILIERILLSL